MVRRLLGPDPATGQRRFTGQVFCYRDYRCADLAYAITGHAAQGGTVHTGIALVTGTEDRQWLYPAMSRGTDMNLAFVFTSPTQVADPRPVALSPPPNWTATTAYASSAKNSRPPGRRKGKETQISGSRSPC